MYSSGAQGANLGSNYPRLPAAAFPGGTVSRTAVTGSVPTASTPGGADGLLASAHGFRFVANPSGATPPPGLIAGAPPTASTAAGACSVAMPGRWVSSNGFASAAATPTRTFGALTTHTRAPVLGGHGGTGTVGANAFPDAQHLAELGAALNELEHYDESALVGQAQLGSTMQSHLRNMIGTAGLSPAGDTPFGQRALSSPFGACAPPSWGALAGGAPASSPKARAATLHAGELPAPGPGYVGPRLEPIDAPLTLEWAMGLVWHFQRNPLVQLPARYLCRLLDEAERVLDAREDAEGAVQKISLQGGTLVNIVGDTHGQLQDVLWIFYKQGVPSPTNRYLFNGDVCDRGTLACEIWAVIFSFMCVWPDSVHVQRGNHEDRLLNMDLHCGGFYDEVLSKYGRVNGTGALVYEKFARIFARLPLASVVDEQVFVVHGGLSRNPAGGFLRLLRANRARTAEVPASSAYASAVELAFVDAMWADPQEAPRVAPNPRGPGLVLFGPDITARFLAETGYRLVVRSHQVPPNNEGYFVHHGGRLVTVFSASNYCGLSGNTGAVLVVRAGGRYEALQHWAPPLERLVDVIIEMPPEAVATPAAIWHSRTLQRRTTAGALEASSKQAEASPKEASNRAERLEREVLRGATRLVVEKKQALFMYWEECDKRRSGFITDAEWEEGMAVVLGDTLPWRTIGRAWQVNDAVTKDVDYRGFLSRFRVVVADSLTGGDRWAEELLGRFYGRLLALRGEAGSLEELEGFLGGGDGKVSHADALDAFRWVLGNTITEEQGTSLLRTLAAHAGPEASPGNRAIGVFEFLSRLDVCFQHQAGVVHGLAVDRKRGAANGQPAFGEGSTSPSVRHTKKEPTPWARSVLSHIGRLLWMEVADGSPKAGSTRMLEVFRNFDLNCDGLLQRDEFTKAVKALFAEYATVLPPALVEQSAADERIGELVDAVDYSGDGMVNYLEFLHAFQPVDRTPGQGLQTDLMEQICTTIWANKPSLLRTMQVLEETSVAEQDGRVGRISREGLRQTLRSLNASLEAARGVGVHGTPLTEMQIDILVDHAAFDVDGTLNYQGFLDAFEIVDTGAHEDDGHGEQHSRHSSPMGSVAFAPFGAVYPMAASANT